MSQPHPILAALVEYAARHQRWPSYVELDNDQIDTPTPELVAALRDLEASGDLVRHDGRYRPAGVTLDLRYEGIKGARLCLRRDKLTVSDPDAPEVSCEPKN